MNFVLVYVSDGGGWSVITKQCGVLRKVGYIWLIDNCRHRLITINTMSQYGFVSVPIDLQESLKGAKYIHAPTPQTVASIKLPDSAVARAVKDYAHKELTEPTFNHSTRVYYYGMAIMKDQFPEWDLDPEVYYVTCLLHDIGTTNSNLHATKMSFEFYGALIARDLVFKHSNGNKEFADAVFEAIARHQDLRTVGNITTLGLILQLATILDNVGKHTGLISQSTVEDVNKNVPRHNWLNCFAEVVDAEIQLKPWAHTSALGVDEFKKGILGNKYMAKYE